MRPLRSQRILARTTVFLLLFGVAGLATLAKQGSYLSRRNPLRHYSKAVKMERAHYPVDFFPVSAHAVPRLVPPQPEFAASQLVQPGLTFRRVLVPISCHHRAPPSQLA